MHSTQQNTKVLIVLMIGWLLHSCNNEPKYLFQHLPVSHTNIDFVNTIVETQDLNILNFHYIYNGGGVGVGDFNNDGLQDLVFSGNQVNSRIYLNKGNLEFEDITTQSGFNSEGWSTGVSIVDINGDGWQDIYISTGGFECGDKCSNQLFINQGKKEVTFVESAEKYGLEDGLYTQQAAFFDYDGDGDLDAYLLHNAIDKRDKNAPTIKSTISKKARDLLLENRNGKFVDVSKEMGIDLRGYGLGITVSDFNNDMKPDVYIANDFLSDDIMYINQGSENGKHLGFVDESHEVLKHTSYNAMGVDVADVNNDGEQDILVLDMLPEYHERQKSMIGFMNYNKFQHSLRNGYHAQFVRNTLQLGNGMMKGKILPYSEVGQMTGLYNTDWSWSPLMADFDNDGDKDIFITNGYGKDITDLDFINYSNQNTSPFGTPKSREGELFKTVEKMKSVKMANYIFENEGDYKFTNRNKEWMESPESISNGAVYADLDNDGDLDLVVNNIDQPAFVMENTTVNRTRESTNNWISIKGLEQGVKVEMAISGDNPICFNTQVRGYLSSVGNVLHMGIGEATQTSLEITYPNGKQFSYEVNDLNKQISLDELSEELSFEEEIEIEPPRISLVSDYKIHVENMYQDFNNQPLLLAQHSRQGPCIVVGNIDGKPGDEYFVGGSKRTAGQIVFPNEASEKRIDLPHADQEDTDAVFFDFEGDGDLDLYVVTGGVEGFAEDSYQDRLYINDGKGNFSESEFLSPAKMSGGSVTSSDYDKDGDIDLFVGGRVTPGQYPNIPQSKLLVNHNNTFIDQTDKLSTSLGNIGMVTDAIWTDMDQDDDLDLLVVGEWMAITYFINNNGQLSQSHTIENSNGLWNTVASADIDNDGDVDYILGNHGFNSRLKASNAEPMVMYTGDYDLNNSQDPIIGQYTVDKEGLKKLYPLHSRDDVMGQVVKVKNRYKRYDEFGKATLTEILETNNQDQDYLKLNNLASSFLINNGNGNFELKDMPILTQVAPIQGVLVEENGRRQETLVEKKKTNLRVYIVGNDYTREKTNGWIDASNGLVMLPIGKGQYHIEQSLESGFIVPGDAREIVKLNDMQGKGYILVGQNKGPFLKFKR